MKIRFTIYLILLLPDVAGAGPDSIRVVIDNNYPPYAFLDEKGDLQGISIDLWRLWEEKTGTKVHITGTNWLDALKRMEEGEFDVIDTLFYTEERAKKYDFSKPYAKIDVVIFFDSQLSGIVDVNSLKGFMVGVKKGDADIDFLRKNQVEYLIEFDNYEEVVKAAIENKIKVFVIDKPPGLYFIMKYKAGDRFRYSDPLFYGEFHRAVKKGNTGLLSFIEKGFEGISERERERIEEKWLGYKITQKYNSKYVKILLIVLGILIILLFATYLWIVMLRRAVKVRTLQLQLEKDKTENLLRELKGAQEKFLNLYNKIPDIIYTMSLNGRFLEVNPRGLLLLGYSEEDLKTLKMEDVVLPEDLEKAREAINKRLAGNTDPVQFRVRTKKGGILVLETTGAILYKDNEPYAIQAIARDITSQKMMEERLLEAQKLESLGLLAGGIAHDFNNILMSIINYIEFIKRDYGNKDLFFSDINHLKSSAERAARLVQQLLGFSRKQLILPTALDVNELIQEFAGSLLKYLGENIKIETYLSDKSPVIFADRSQVEQMLMNIVLNSRDAMPEGGRLTITTDVIYLENEIEGNRSYTGYFVTISIRDTGVGISEENLKKVFEPFFTTKPIGKGTGLGLSMVYGAMQQNRGFVRIFSKVGQGTEVVLYFPRSEKKVENKLPQKTTSEPIKKFITVLLVEDDDEVRSVIGEILKSANINVIEARDAGEALREFENNSDIIKLVISDIVMPDKNGIELKGIIEKRYGPIQFLFITGYSDEILKSRGINIDKLEILYKPFNTERIISAINKLLKGAVEPLD